MTEHVINLASVTRSYGSKRVLDQLNFRVPRGSVVGLLGKNGAGKSTLIKCALGLLGVDNGDCRIFDENAWDLPPEVKQRVGYVPQVGADFPWMKVKNLLAYTGAFYRNWCSDRVEKLLQTWELDAKDRVGALSVGQRQKLAIICALGHDPDLLILDEPVASLDPMARRHFLQQLIDLNLDAEKTILFSTHITSDLERVAARVAVLKDGRIFFDGELDELRERVKRLHIYAGEDLPQTLPIPNILNAHIDGPSATVTVDLWQEELPGRIEQALQARVQVENLNLEDFFLEVHS